MDTQTRVFIGFCTATLLTGLVGVIIGVMRVNGAVTQRHTLIWSIVDMFLHPLFFAIALIGSDEPGGNAIAYLAMGCIAGVFSGVATFRGIEIPLRKTTGEN